MRFEGGGHRVSSELDAGGEVSAVEVLDRHVPQFDPVRPIVPANTSC